MCFVISIVLLILSYNFFMADNLILAIASLAGSIFFIILMVRNIKYVKNLKKEQREKKE